MRGGDRGDWQQKMTALQPFDSMMGFCADFDEGMELLRLRERMRGWRFYDSLRTDAEAPARLPQVATYTPVLSADGSDLSAAIATIHAIGDADGLDETVDDAFAGARVHGHSQGYATISMAQHGLLRPLSAAELSDGTLRYLMLAAALMSPRPPEMIALNEPETSLHPSLIGPLARLLARAAATTQILVVTHNAALIEALADTGNAVLIALEKTMSETTLANGLGAPWTWPTR
jgi:predicted ATPase